MTLRGHAVTVRAFGATHTGRVRAGNEDSYLVADDLYAVADGMGGHQAGEIASDAALEPLRELEIPSSADESETGEALAEAVRQANTLVVQRARDDAALSGMGTTLTAIAVRDGQLHVAHVGDSRAYLLRDGEQISQLTTDHTLVERLVQEGRLSRDEAATHPQRNVITRAIGHEDTVEVELLPPLRLRDGDQVLLCSDGLSGPVDDRRMAELLAQTADGHAAVRALVSAANAAGGPDNITAVLVRVGDRWDDANDDTTTDDEVSSTQQLATPPTSATASDGTDARTPPPPGVTPTADDTGNAASSAVTIDTSPPPSGEPWAQRLGRVGAQQGVDAAEPGTRPSWSRPRLAIGVLAVFVIVAVLFGGAWVLLSRSYFVGAHDGMVAVYRGMPQPVAGVSLSWVVDDEISTTPVDRFPPFRQQAIAEGLSAQSLDDARRIVADLQNQLREDTVPTPQVGQPLTEPSAGP